MQDSLEQLSLIHPTDFSVPCCIPDNLTQGADKVNDLPELLQGLHFQAWTGNQGLGHHVQSPLVGSLWLSNRS